MSSNVPGDGTWNWGFPAPMPTVSLSSSSHLISDGVFSTPAGARTHSSFPHPLKPAWWLLKSQSCWSVCLSDQPHDSVSCHMTVALWYLLNAWTPGSGLRTCVVAQAAPIQTAWNYMASTRMTQSIVPSWDFQVVGWGWRVHLPESAPGRTMLGTDETCHELWTCFNFPWNITTLLTLGSLLLLSLCTVVSLSLPTG